MIRTSGATKRYGRILAVDDVDLDVREGDRYGLLGPNGSGKTTLVRMLLGLVFATSGRIDVLGRAIPRHACEVLRDVGAIVEGPAGYPHLSGRTNLGLIDAAGPGSVRRTRSRRIDEALDRVGLGGIDARPIKAYSLGMRQRLGIAGALLRRPRLLILDEPTNGLDPRGIREVRELLEDLSASGVTMMLSSHLLAEVEQLCTRVGIMDAGRLVAQDDLATMRALTGRVVVDSPDAARIYAMLDGSVAHRDGERLIVADADPTTLNARLVGAGIRVSAIAPERRTLEEVVLSVTGNSADRFDTARSAAPSGPPVATIPTGTGTDDPARPAGGSS